MVHETTQNPGGADAADCPLCGVPAPVLVSFTNYCTHHCGPCDHRFNVHVRRPDDEHVFGDQWLDSRAASAPLLSYLARSRIGALREAAPAGGRLLEVGCGTGEFVDCSLRAGFDSYGLDTAPGAIRVAGDAVGEDRVFCGLLDDLADQLGTFDVIVGFHVFEHVPDPVAFACSLRDRLVPGGLLHLRVPNANGLVNRARGRRFFLETHISHFSAASLQRALEDAEFVDARVWTEEFGGRWFDLINALLLGAASGLARPVNRRAYATSGAGEPSAGSGQPSAGSGRSTRLRRAFKRAALRQYQLAALATHFGGYPLWSLVSSLDLGGELAVTARRAGGPTARVVA